MVNQFGGASGTHTNQFGWTTSGGSSGNAGLLKINVPLSGTLTTTFMNVKSGTYALIITSELAGAPELFCTVSKRDLSDNAETANHHARNSNDSTSLEVIWGPNQYLQLKKSTNSFNGIYTIIVYGDV